MQEFPPPRSRRVRRVLPTGLIFASRFLASKTPTPFEQWFSKHTNAIPGCIALHKEAVRCCSRKVNLRKWPELERMRASRSVSLLVPAKNLVLVARYGAPMDFFFLGVFGDYINFDTRSKMYCGPLTPVSEDFLLPILASWKSLRP